MEYYSQNPIMNIGMIIFFLVFLMLFTMLLVFLRSLFIREKQQKFTPAVSIIIPAYNEEKSIAKTISQVINCNYPKFEIICVDDGSTDNTAKIIKSFPVKLIRGKHKGKAAALNLAIPHAKYDFILSLDADTIIDKKFIHNVIRPFKDAKVGATNGLAHIHKPKNWIEHFQDIEFYYNNLIRRSFSKVFSNGIWFFGAAACFRKQALKKVGFFSTNVLTEDMDVSLKIFKKGYHVLTVNAEYETRAAHSLVELFNQRMRWFFGGIQSIFKHRDIKKTPAIAFLYFNQSFWAVFSIIAIPLIIYQVFYWLPETGVIPYLIRWFSLAGPVYVLYKIPEWGLSFINIFGVSAGIITAFMLVTSIKAKLTFPKTLAIFFYFPYTIILNVVMIFALFKYFFSKKRYFID